MKKDKSIIKTKKDIFFNRELSWLEFNARVLAEAMDSSNPLFERLKFIGIVSSNLDEFFMVRIASLIDVDHHITEITDKARKLMKKQNEYFVNTIVPDLKEAGIIRVKPQSLNTRQIDYIRKFFQKEIIPVLTPIAISEDRAVPVFTNMRMYMVVGLVKLSGKSSKKHAVVEIPQNFPRMISLPAVKSYQFVLLEDIFSLFIGDLFAGYEIVDTGLARFTRAAEMTLDEEKDEDFKKVMTEALRMRRKARVVRLEISASKDIIAFLKKKLNITDKDIYEISSWFDLKGISQFVFLPGYEELKQPIWEPKPVVDFETNNDIWKLLRKKDVYVHHPYESFDAVNRFVSEAADDPDVLAIKQTLYRAGKESPIINSLERAAEKGKQVTVLVELKARFDEESNIEWARRLETAGASILYGVTGVKTHAKVCLVVRRESDGIKRYVHLSTGNYNEKTARLYSDIGMFTSDEDISNDATALFNMITGYSQPIDWSKLAVAPYGLRRNLMRLITREAMRSTKAHPGLIIAKMNSLSDPAIIEDLYKASQSGVQIKLNIRGICCLKPGIKNLSENIEVVSIVDMFLEHSRIFYFANGGDEEVYLSSADWMPRNLDRRIEVLFPIDDNKIKKELIELLRLYFKDNVKSWRLLSNGSYKKIEKDKKSRFRIQEYLQEKSIKKEELLLKTKPKELKPQKPFTRS